MLRDEVIDQPAAPITNAQKSLDLLYGGQTHSSLCPRLQLRNCCPSSFSYTDVAQQLRLTLPKLGKTHCVLGSTWRWELAQRGLEAGRHHFQGLNPGNTLLPDKTAMQAASQPASPSCWQLGSSAARPRQIAVTGILGGDRAAGRPGHIFLIVKIPVTR